MWKRTEILRIAKEELVVLLPEANLFIPDELNTEIPQSSKTYKVDTARGRIVGYTDEQDAVLQAVEKLLSTDKYAYVIYDWAYGNELNSIIGTTKSYLEVEAPRIIEEALLEDDRIVSVTDFEIIEGAHAVGATKVLGTRSVVMMYAEGTALQPTGAWKGTANTSANYLWERIVSVTNSGMSVSDAQLIQQHIVDNAGAGVPVVGDSYTLTQNIGELMAYSTVRYGSYVYDTEGILIEKLSDRQKSYTERYLLDSYTIRFKVQTVFDSTYMEVDVVI